MAIVLNVEAPIGRQLKLERIAAGKRQYEIARQIGIAPEKLSKFEIGMLEPSAEMVAKIREAIAA